MVVNLKIKVNNFELEIQNGDANRVERALVAAFTYLEGGSFVETFENTEVEERPTNSKRNYIEAVNGVREHENGTKEYKCAYSCTCGNRGIRYVHGDAEKTTCHKCKSELKIVPATDSDAHDEEFNYFVAY